MADDRQSEEQGRITTEEVTWEGYRAGNDDLGGAARTIVKGKGKAKRKVLSSFSHVRELVERCQCPTQFPMIRVAEGKYRIGDTKVMIYVRILRSHVMVRVGGGWNTLENYLDKHDPCRCKAGHRRAHSASLTMKSGPTGTSPPQMVANYERSIGGASPSNSISPSTKSAGRSPSHHAAPLSTPPVHRKQTAPAQLPATPLRGRSLDRPDSQLTHTSSDCSIPSDDGSSPAASTRRIAAKSAGSRIPVLSASNSRIPTPVGNTSSPRRSPERSGSRTRRRSIDNSALKPTTSEASANTSSFQRGVHGRYSYRNYNTPSSGTLGRRRPQTPRGSTTPAANRTNKSSGLAGCPNSQAGSTVSLSGERKGLGRPSTCPPKASSPLSERSNLPPLLREILNDKAALASDENVLAKMADLVAKYREVNNGCTASSRSSSQENVEVQGKPEFHEEEVKSVIEPEEVKQNCSPIVSETSLDANEEQPSQVEEILQQMSDLDAEFGEELKRLEEESKNVERQDSLELFESLEESLIKVPDQDVLCGDGNNNSLNQRPPETESPTRFQDMLLLPDDPPSGVVPVAHSRGVYGAPTNPPGQWGHHSAELGEIATVNEAVVATLGHLQWRGLYESGSVN
ncbi:unnamed protein product [Cyprideis torosa]|uniref:Uncharacterized protein n=1 Tax=Cyprideis torosa TaxID=163714 RepID=A0A7R8ZKF2_9CRUS|nr:unnamed protein product [Cyprideis torosa]CAG0884348.1 unnamed protein product [Cyprideis torosa]